jgi:hypothetical protein
VGARTEVNNGGQTVTSNSGVVGLYGRTSLGVVHVDASLIGGLSGNNSTREVAAPGGLEQATAQFSSWFLAPSLGMELPVLENASGVLSVVGRASYILGGAQGYTEAGSSMNLTVGDQTIGMLDARLGLEGVMWTGSDNAADVAVTTKGGLFVQANLAGSTTPVTVLGQTVTAQGLAGTHYGVYGGLGFTVQTGAATLSLGGEGQLRDDGLLSGAVKAGLSAKF